MDCPLEPVNHDDTSVSPSADINEHDLDYMVIPEISLEVGDDVSELSSEEMVPTDSNYSGPSKKFSNKKNKGKEKATVLATVSPSGTKNAFDLMHSQQQKNARITDHNDAPNVFIGSKVYIDNIRHSVCNIEMVDGKACDIKVKTDDSMTALWRHLNLEHGYTKNSVRQPNRKQTTITKAFEISSAKPHNTTEQAIYDKTITEVIVMQNLSLSFTEEKIGKLKVLSMRDLIKLASASTWINENFELNNAVLVVTFLRYPHTADAIVKCIEDVLEHWNLKTKVFSITSDSGANMKSACNKLGVKWVPCSAHILNLIVQKRLLPAMKLITRMNRLIIFFTTPKQSEHLEAVQESIQKQQKSNQEKFDDDKILFLAIAIDPRCKNFEYEGAILKGQDYFRLEYDQIISNKGLGSSSSKATLDLSGSSISMVFMAVQQNATYKNEVDQYLMIETIGPLDNLLQW
ncbi:45009_t:CDS:2 [Gigaspora margarita]|uniref:45009_t:CDS:1 n=1 Tax=Gigaspora margarita TaxID=4874 RepID=A0ABN7UPK0_GIGMA|nr:45009_t:CDS:2 [Gigaspora margarita]